MPVQVEDDFLVAKVQPPPAGLITDIIIPPPGLGDFPYDRVSGDGSHYWSLDYVRADTSLAWPATNVWYIQLTTYDFDADEEFVFGPEHPYIASVPILGVQHFGDLIGPYGDNGAGFYIKCYLLNRVPPASGLKPWEDPTVATFQCQKKVIVAVGGAAPAPPGSLLPPSNVTIGQVTVRYQGAKALVSIEYIPPASRFDRLHCYLYAPDTVTDKKAGISGPGSTKPPRWIIARDSTEASSAGILPSNVGGPEDKGVFPHHADTPMVSFEHDAPPYGKIEKWRAVLCSGYLQVPENPIDSSPFTKFDVTLPDFDGSLGTVGTEIGPNILNGWGAWYQDDKVKDAQMFPTWWFELTWDLPVYDPRWDSVVGWQVWAHDPLKETVNDGFFQVATLPKTHTKYTLDARWNLTRVPNDFQLYVVPVDRDGHVNSFIKPIAPAKTSMNCLATFTVSSSNGLRLNYADGTTIDGIDFSISDDGKVFKIKNLDLGKVYGPSISPEYKVVDGVFQWGDNLDWKKFDPAKLGQAFDLNTATGVLDFPFDPAEFDAATGIFTIKSLKPGLFGVDFGTDTNGKIIVTGVDFTKAKPGTFSPEFSQGSGNIFQVEKLAAEKIKTGVLEVGGVAVGGERVSRFKVFNAAGNTLIGWIGDDTADSGYDGAFFKRVLIGTNDPATAGIYASDSGVIVKGSVITGTLAAGVIYAGAINATQINSGYLNIGSGSNMPGQLFVYNGSTLIGWIGTYQWGGSGPTYEGGWIKRFQIGGNDPASAKVAVDSAGNVTIQGTMSAGTILAGVAYLGTLTADRVTAGTLASDVIYSGYIRADKITAQGELAGHTITGSTLTLNKNNFTTSIDNLNSIAPVTNTYTGVRVKDNVSSNWAGMSSDGVGVFRPAAGMAILFYDALQVYNPGAPGTVAIRLGSWNTGMSDPSLQINGVRVVRAQYPTTPVSTLADVLAALRYHGLIQ